MAQTIAQICQRLLKREGWQPHDGVRGLVPRAPATHAARRMATRIYWCVITPRPAFHYLNFSCARAQRSRNREKERRHGASKLNVATQPSKRARRRAVSVRASASISVRGGSDGSALSAAPWFARRGLTPTNSGSTSVLAGRVGVSTENRCFWGDTGRWKVAPRPPPRLDARSRTDHARHVLVRMQSRTD